MNQDPNMFLLGNVELLILIWLSVSFGFLQCEVVKYLWIIGSA